MKPAALGVLLVPACLPLLLAASSAGATTTVTLRTQSISVSNLPEVTSVLDVRRVGSQYPILNSGDFALYEKGEKKSRAASLVKLGDTKLGVALIVALDASGSMRGRPLAAIQNGLVQLVSRKRPQDRMAVLSFADDSHWEAKWDASEAQLKDSFNKLQGRGQYTRLYDAVEVALEELRRQSSQKPEEGQPAFPARQCILLISDGHDEASRATLVQLEPKIKESRVRMDSVGTGRSPLWFDTLRRISDAGFGEFRAAHSADDLGRLVGTGINAILDMPAVRFDDTKLEADGQSHVLAVEYVPSGMRDEFTSEFPKQPFYRNYLLMCAAAAAVFAVALWLAFRPARRPSAQPILRAEEQQVTPRKPSARAATVVEGGDGNIYAEAQPLIRYTEDRVPAAPRITMTPERSKRQATVLASPQPAGTVLALRAINGPYSGQVFEANAKEFWIGSAANNHLCLSADAALSGNHACIRTEAAFSRLYDNGSLNNTWVNGRAIGEEVTLVSPGDRLRIGASEFVIEARA